MSITNILLWCIVGALAGWIASMIMKSRGGLVRNIIIGIVGSFFGGWIASLIGIGASSPFSIGGIAIAIVGSCLLIFIGKYVFKS